MTDLQPVIAGNREAVDHPFFGELSLPDFLRLQMIHARHHRRQLPGAAG